MHRRRFLKYAAVGAAVVGAGLAGYEFDGWQSSLGRPSVSTLTKTRTLTETTRLTTTETVRLASLHGRLFFDYNGNGTQDGEEPPVADALVQLKDESGKTIAETPSDSSGDYFLEDVRIGSYKVHLEADEKFRYMCRSGNELRAVTDDYPVSLEGSLQANIGLMEGFLTLPLLPRTKYSIGRFYDWDPDPLRYLWWSGKRGSESEHGGSPNHTGVDYDIRVGEPVVAAAPGIATETEVGPQGQISVGILHHVQNDVAFCTSCNHLSHVSVQKGQRVSRGQEIGESGATGRTYPHLHFNIAAEMKRTGLQAFPDPYRPVFSMHERNGGFWGRPLGSSADPSWVLAAKDQNPNLSGHWTKDNDPQYSR